MQNIEKEKEEIDLLLGKGFDIKIRLLGKDRIFRSRKLSMGVMLQLSRIFINMKLDEKDLESTELNQRLATQYHAVVDNAEALARVVAVCITGNEIYQYFIKKSVLKHYEPKDILEFSQTLLNTSDYGNFLLSIALMNGNRPTKANPIEKK